MIIYKATNKTNGFAYVGATKRSLAKRIIDHRSDAKNRPHGSFQFAVKEYGIDGFEWRVLHECASVVEMRIMEVFFIQMEGTYTQDGRGYNDTLGGGGAHGLKMSPEQRERMRLSQHTGVPRSEDVRKRVSATKTGTPIHPYVVLNARTHMKAMQKARWADGVDRKRSPEVRERLSVAMKSYWANARRV